MAGFGVKTSLATSCEC